MGLVNFFVCRFFYRKDVTCAKIESGIIERSKKGEARGIAKDKINVARNFLDILSDEVIVEKVELDIEVVRSLRS